VSCSLGQLPWPAEPFSQAVNLTPIEGPGQNDFWQDLSSAYWNPVTRRLWTCRNGPTNSTSKLWAIVEDGAGGYKIDDQGGLRGEWTDFGDFEGVTLADFSDHTVFGIIENDEHIKEYDVSTYGTRVLINDWNTGGCLPGEGGEGITFVPDNDLAARGFLDQNNNPYVSHGGMGGLMFVGHQAFGRIYVFDLQRGAGPDAFTVVGEFVTSYAEISELFYDRSTAKLYVLHDADFDKIEIMNLSSIPFAGSPSCSQVSHLRRFDTAAIYSFPQPGNYEGFTIQPASECVNGGRKMFLTIDDGGAGSLYLFQHFTPGCEWQLLGLPAVSAWGVWILVQLLLIAATLFVGHRSRAIVS